MRSPFKARTIYLLKRAEVAVRTGLEEALKDTGVTPGQYAVLSLLGALPDASSAELARRAGVTPQTMSEILTAFEAKGFILRETSAQHRRVLCISLTEQGASLLARCEKEVDVFEARLFSAFNDTERDVMRTLLSRITKST